MIIIVLVFFSLCFFFFLCGKCRKVRGICNVLRFIEDVRGKGNQKPCVTVIDLL